MTAPELTLKQIQNDLKRTQNVRQVQVSDFLTSQQKQRIERARETKREKKALFDSVDAYIAEIIGRFGYETYRAWKMGEISEALMMRMVLAERAREARERYYLEALIVSAVAGANRPSKGGKSPKSLKVALNILRDEKKKGGMNG